MAFLWPENCLHHTAQPTKPELSRCRCFFKELVDFISGNAGKAFDKNLSGTIGWHQVIQDLINKTANAKTVFMGRAMGQGNSKLDRGTELLFITPTNASGFFEVAGGGGANDSTEPPNIPDEWGGDGGISIIEIVVEQEG